MDHCPPLCLLFCGLPAALFWLGSYALMRYLMHPDRAPIIEIESEV